MRRERGTLRDLGALGSLTCLGGTAHADGEPSQGDRKHHRDARDDGDDLPPVVAREPRD